MVSTMQPAFQDQLQGNHCWGCGKDNPQGLHIKSYWDGSAAICHWQPQPWHCASPTHVLNGGIIGALIDCHAIISAMALAAQQAGVALSSPSPIWYVTGKLEITYHKPTPLGPSVELRARFEVQSERKTLVTCTLSAAEQLCATGTVLAVRVPSAWMQA